MTEREAAIVTAYTGILIGTMSKFHELAESLLERPIYTHEFGDKTVMSKLKQAAHAKFTGIEIND